MYLSVDDEILYYHGDESIFILSNAMIGTNTQN